MLTARKVLSALCPHLLACTNEAVSSSMEEQRPPMHPTTHQLWVSPSIAFPGCCRSQDPAFPVECSCLYFFPSPVHVCCLIVTQLTWLQAGQAPLPSGMHVVHKTNPNTSLYLYVCTRCLQHPPPPPGSWHRGSQAQAGHGGFNLLGAWIEAISQAQRPEGKHSTHSVCPWQGIVGFLSPLCPTFSHGVHP